MKYHLLFKSAAAEMKAWKELTNIRKEKVSVIYELTRGRKFPTRGSAPKEDYNFEANLAFIMNDMKQCEVCVVDITREPLLTSEKIRSISASSGGYKEWREIVDSLSSKNPKVRPTLIINPSEDESPDEYISNLKDQFNHFSEKYDLIAYRISALHDQEFQYDLEILRDDISRYIDNGNTFQIELDYEYIRPSTGMLHARNASILVSLITDIVPNCRIVTLGTSFPKNVTDIGNSDTDAFNLEEVSLHSELSRIQNHPIEYGDYGSINPLRNENAIPAGKHLRARVDYPTSDQKIYYHRVAPLLSEEDGKLVSPRSAMYAEAAAKVRADSRFTPIPDSWGCKMVELAARSLPAGASPSFWISVRMEAHICRQIDRVFSATTSSRG